MITFEAVDSCQKGFISGESLRQKVCLMIHETFQNTSQFVKKSGKRK